jgi:hypothetical protein
MLCDILTNIFMQLFDSFKSTILLRSTVDTIFRSVFD